MSAKRRRWSIPVALAAAYLLLLQSVLATFAAGMAPNPSQLDAFGNVICSREGVGQLPSGNPSPSHLPSCCVLGCSMFSPAYAPPPDAGLTLGTLSFETVAFVFPAVTHLDFARERSPSNPRAPPLTA